MQGRMLYEFAAGVLTRRREVGCGVGPLCSRTYKL
jgi:hypothetical protein